MISLCVPSRGRPRTLLRLFRSAAATAAGSFEVCAWLDEDDPEINSYPARVRIKYGRGPRPVDSDGILKTSGLWTKAASLASGDILCLIGDDSAFETAGWDAAVEAAFREVPDRILMVYPEDGTGRHRPETLFISREWFEAVGEFTPEGYPGWFSDEWIWTVAVSVGRVAHLPDVKIWHHQGAVKDETWHDGETARRQMRGLEGIRGKFWSHPEKLRRTEQADKLRTVMNPSIRIMPDPEPQWVREVVKTSGRASTVVSVHCYAGTPGEEPDKRTGLVGDVPLVLEKLPYYQRHGHPVIILSPEDSPVVIDSPGVTCRHGGIRQYVGQESLDRQRTHMKMLLEEPYDWFLMNDADSMCVSRDIPPYLYDDENVLWSNVVDAAYFDPNPARNPTKLAFQPPYFASRSVLEKLLAVGPIEADPVTPFIDWLMVVLAIEGGVPFKSFPDGVSFAAWSHGNSRGDVKMVNCVRGGKVMLHSVKHQNVVARVVRAHDEYLSGRG